MAKTWDSRLEDPSGHPHPKPHNLDFYGKCVIGGILSCGLTHTAVVPLDVVKCKMQVYPEKYKGLIKGIKTVLAEEGAAGLRLGWLPTFIGYSMQGAFKFGLYEVFKDVYSNLAGQENAKNYKGAIWLAGSASAEFFCRYCSLSNGDGESQNPDVSCWHLADFFRGRHQPNVTSKSRNKISVWKCPSFMESTDPLHNGKILFLRKNGANVLQKCVHCSKGILQ